MSTPERQSNSIAPNILYSLIFDSATIDIAILEIL